MVLTIGSFATTATVSSLSSEPLEMGSKMAAMQISAAKVL